jgi:hypothetical protein
MPEISVERHDATPKSISKNIAGPATFPLSHRRLIRPLGTKKLFSIYDYRARPTTGSDCGSFLTQSNLVRYVVGFLSYFDDK